MIKVMIYLPNGRVISAFLKQRQYNSLVQQIRQKLPLKKRIKSWIRWPWFKRKGGGSKCLEIQSG